MQPAIVAAVLVVDAEAATSVLLQVVVPTAAAAAVVKENIAVHQQAPQVIKIIKGLYEVEGGVHRLLLHLRHRIPLLTLKGFITSYMGRNRSVFLGVAVEVLF